MPPDPDELLIETERMRSVFQQAPLTLLVTVINAGLTAVVLAPTVDHLALLTWAGLIVAVSIARAVARGMFLRLDPQGERCRPWVFVSVLGSFTTGTLWGVGLIALFPASETHQLFLALVVGGMCAGASAVNSAHLPSVLAFVLPASLPLALGFLAEGSAPRVVSALMILIFAVALFLISLQAHRAFGERIRFQLALDRQRRDLSDANEQLHREMEERRTVEATLHQAQKMEAIGHLTGGIAHDFNNLLTVVLGNLALIRRASAGDARITGHAVTAERAAERGARLIDGLLAFARRQPLRPERVSLNALLREFEPILLRALGERIRFQMLLEPSLPDCHADPAHFESAILNLVINARDAMPQGGRLLITTGLASLEPGSLAGTSDAGPGRYVSVSVQDSGSGMSEEVLAKALDPFFTTKEAGKGSGLGLSQVYGFARQSGGHMRLRSEPGAGTCATLCLPMAAGEMQDHAALAGAEEARPSFPGVGALLVEDDPDILDLVAACLSDAGCRVRTARTGDEALEILRSGDELRVLLTDVALAGGLGGVELARAARRLRPGLAVILVTGHAAATLAMQGVVAGEFPLLRKPFRPGELLAQVGEAVGTSTPPAQVPKKPPQRA